METASALHREGSSMRSTRTTLGAGWWERRDRLPHSPEPLLLLGPMLCSLVIGKNRSDSILICFFYFNLCILLLLLQVEHVACSLKYTGWPILKALTFKGVTLFHSYRDEKLQNRE